MIVSRVLFVLFVAALALAPAQAAEKLVTVTGEATVAVAPDTAMIRLGVGTQEKTAREASEANAKQMTAVLAAIKDTGVADRDIQTSRLSLQPQYDPNKSGTARLTGFQASNQVTVRNPRHRQAADSPRSRHYCRRQRNVGHRIRGLGAIEAARPGAR